MPALPEELEPTSVAYFQRRRTQLGQDIQPHQALALLSLQDKQASLLISEGDTGHPTPVLHHMPLGLELLVKRGFKGGMPSEAQLENAIMLVEDAVMPLLRVIPQRTIFATQDQALLEVAKVAMGGLSHVPMNPWPYLSREAVEHLFGQLVLQAGRPQLPLAGIPQSPRWAAALLYLREVLHHWQMPGLHLLQANR